jgi:hypothetical protein
MSGDVRKILMVNGSVSSIRTLANVRNMASNTNYPVAVAVDRSGNVYVANQATFDGEGGNPSATGTVQEILAVNGSIPTSPTILTVASGFSFIP